MASLGPLYHDRMNTSPNCISRDWVVILSTTVALLTILQILIYSDSALSLLWRAKRMILDAGYT
jgi:hypothetical protein